MASPSVTYSFTNGSAADALQVDQNFTDLINGMTDGSKTFSIAALTLSGTFTPNGTLGASIIPASNALYNLGNSSAGLGTVYLGNGTKTVALQAGALSATYNFITPTALPSAQAFLTVDSLGQMATGRLYALGQQISSSCGAFTTTSTSFVAVTNLSVTLTTSGRPVFVGIMPDGNATNPGTFSTTNTEILYIQIFRASTVVGYFQVKGATSVIVPSNIFTVDPVAAGTYTYTVKIVSSSGTAVSLFYSSLMAYEL